MKQNRINLLLAALLILLAAISRVALYPNNYSPIIGMALFGGAVIKDKRFAFTLPILAMFISDVMFEASGIAKGFWGWGQLVGYLILAVITVIGFRLKKINAVNILGFSLISSVIFFLVSNLGFFLIDNPHYHTYPNDLSGLKACYIAALPFFKAHVDLMFTVFLFGTYYLVTTYIIDPKQVTA